MHRIFLNSSAELDVEEEDLLAVGRGHSTHTATLIYSVEEGFLPMLSSDILLRHRNYGELWLQVIGLRKGFPPMLPMIQRREVRDVKMLAVTAAGMVEGAAGADLSQVSGLMEGMTAMLTSRLHEIAARMASDTKAAVVEGMRDVLARQEPGMFGTAFG